MGRVMKPVLLGRFEPDSPEWHAARAGRIGGSDIAAVVGHGFHTRDELLQAKRLPPRPDTPSRSQLRGQWLEPALLAYAAHRGYTANPSMHGTWQHPDRPWQICNPDGVTADGTLIEAKSTHTRNPDKWGRGGTDQIPPGYLCQVTWGCGLLGLDRWVLPVIATKVKPDGYSADFDFALYKGTFNPDLYDYLIDQAERFMLELTEEIPL